MDDYAILGVSKNDSITIITQKYKKLALKYHPDRNRHNQDECEEKFKEISKAYHNIVNKKSPNFNLEDNKFADLFSRFNNIKNYFKSVDYNTLINNVIDKVSHFNEFIDDKNKKLEKTEDLYINANIELFDIYNNVNKKISIERLRKCSICKGIGKIITKDKTITICKHCNGKKYINKLIDLSFNCKTKNITFQKYSNHDKYKMAGDIIININPKKHEYYEVYNNYDLIYNYKIQTLHEHISISFKHLNNKHYNFNISNPKLNYKYKLKNLGLLYNDNDNLRGELYIIFDLDNKIIDLISDES